MYNVLLFLLIFVLEFKPLIFKQFNFKKMKTQKEIRANFWETFTEFKSEYKKTKRQNYYNATIRSAFVDYVDGLRKDGVISEKLANRVTL